MNSSPRGRRAGSPDTRAQILEVARRRFLLGGYQAVTLRSVAAEAGVDVALVSYYFGSKKGLFGAALALTANPAEALAEAAQGDLATFPERALYALLAVWEDPESGAPLRAMIAGATQDQALTDLVKQMIERELIERLAARIGGVDARPRAAACCAHLVGLVVARYVLRLEPLASVSGDEIVRIFAPPLRHALRDPTRRPRPRGHPTVRPSR